MLEDFSRPLNSARRGAEPKWQLSPRVGLAYPLSATGVVHVFVNGVQVLKDGEHTGAKPGQVVRGPGWTGWKDASS